MTKDQLLQKANEVLQNSNQEKRFIFIQVDKDIFTLIDGKKITEINIDLKKGLLWVGDSCYIEYKKIGYKTDEQALQFYGELMEAWIQAVIS